MPKDRPPKRFETSAKNQPFKARKQLSSPAATGDRGGSFERRVQAVRLLAMCLGATCAGIRQNFTIVKLQFQARIFEHNTDDLVVLTHCSATGQSATVRMQMKRSLRASVNEVFQEAVGLAWLDFVSPEFQRELDETLIVFDVSSASAMKGAVEVVSFARSSTGFESWSKKVHAPGFSNDSIRTAFKAIKGAVDAHSAVEVPLEELHEFVLHLRFLAQDLDSDRADGVETQKSLIRHSVPSHDENTVWAKLLDVCSELNGQAGEIDIATLGRHLGPLAEGFRFARLFRSGLIGLSSGKSNVHTHDSPDMKALAELLVPLLKGQSKSSDAASMDDMPASRSSSANSYISRRLDRIADWQKQHRYGDSLDELNLLEPDLPAFDEHQKARWYLLRGAAYWHLGENEFAAADFELAPTFCDSDDRVCAAGVRALILRDAPEQAAALGQILMARFPESFVVWITATNALIQSGSPFSGADIPVAFIDKAAAWQLVANALATRDDDEGAVRAMQTAMEKADVSFFVRETYLRLALHWVATSPIQVFSRSLSDDKSVVLQDAVSSFDDREHMLWSIQSPHAQKTVTLHLAYALVLLQKPDEALSIIEEGRRRGIVESPEILRFELEALCDLNRLEEAVSRFSGRIMELPEEALLVFAQACFRTGHADLIALVDTEIHNRKPSETITFTRESLRYLRWEAMLQRGEKAVLRQEIADRGITPRSNCIADLVFAARVQLGERSDDVLRLALIERVAELVPDATDPQDLALSGQLMAQAKRYTEAIDILERLLPTTTFTPLHIELLDCYIHTEHRSRARDLLNSMPAKWLKSGDAQDLALTLYREAGDWPRMRHVAEVVVKAMPTDASAWLQLIQIAANQGTLEFKQFLFDVPALLTGDPTDLLLVANAELRYGALASGLQRVYRVMRDNLDDVEIAATHLKLMCVANAASPEVLATPAEVCAGCSVELIDGRGRARQVTIDLETDIGLRASSEFISPTSLNAQALMGLKVGDFTHANHNGMNSYQYQIKSICTVHKRLIDLSNQCVDNAFNPSKSMKSFRLPENEDGSYDFSVIHEMLESSNARALQTLDIYQHHAVSLGLISKMLGHDVIDIIRHWPVDAPVLEVSTGLPENENVFAASFDDQSPLVVDLSLLVELARLDLLDVLEHFPTVFVSTMTHQALLVKQERLSAFQTGGTLFAHEGRLGFTKHTAEKAEQDKTFIEAMLLAVSAYCEVIPAYGPDAPEPNLASLKQILSDEDFSSILISLERKACLLSLDGRLRKFAYLLEIPTASAQALLSHVAGLQALTLPEYTRAVVKMLIARRHFIEITSGDLIRMMYQGEAFSTMGLNALREYLATPLVSFNSTVLVIRDFICEMYAQGRCDFGAMLELIEFCLEPLLRHPDCPIDFETKFFTAVKSCLRATNLDWRLHNIVQDATRKAKARSLRPVKPVTLAAKPIMGMRVPFYSSQEPGFTTD